MKMCSCLVLNYQIKSVKCFSFWLWFHNEILQILIIIFINKLFFSSLKYIQRLFYSCFLNLKTSQAYDLLLHIGSWSVVLNLGCTLELPYTFQIRVSEGEIQVVTVIKVLQVIPMYNHGWESLAYSNTFISQTSLKMLSEQMIRGFFPLKISLINILLCTRHCVKCSVLMNTIPIFKKFTV